MLLAVGCWLSVVSGQSLERTIQLPESGWPFALCYSPLYGKLYCESWAGDEAGNVVVIDGGSNGIVASFWLHGWLGENVNLGYNSRNGKVYGVTYGFDDVYLNVIDGRVDSVVAVIPAQYTEPYYFCYNPQDDKLYWTTSGTPGIVTVMSGTLDSILTTVPVGSMPTVLYYCGKHDKVYCANAGSRSVTIIDGATDSVLATVAVRDSPSAFCYNPQNDKVYCAGGSWNDGSISVLDGTGDSVLATLSTYGLPVALCYNERDNKVYCANGGVDRVAVIDGASDSLVASVSAGVGVSALCYVALNDKVYCANSGSDDVTVIDGASDTELRTIDVGGAPQALAYNPVQNRVYVANSGSSTIAVLCDSGGVASRAGQPAPVWPLAATVVRGSLHLSGKIQAALFDMSGRMVASLHAGANDVSGLSPGVYFVREAQAQAVRKVVIQR
ncbi:MAG: T9SS type A sorting domain-containing protein [candidate division WOR-3 bacterium]|nr:T9SS type A sorting domain-containing protein [candidate division WOR-3 bacterium]